MEKRIYINLCLFIIISIEICLGQKAQMNLLLDNDELSYEIRYDNKLIISSSPLGINVDNQWLGKNVTYKNETNTSKNNIKTYSIQKQGQTILYLDVQEFDDGIAFRYRIPTDGPKCIYGEATSFTFPSETKVWYASGPFQYGWIQAYQERNTDSLTGELLAPPATFLTPAGIYAAITEANLFNFHGAVLYGTAPNKVQFGYADNKGHLISGIITGLPQEKYWHEVVRNVPWIAFPKGGENEIITPWRVLMLAKDLNGLVNNQIISKICDKPDKTLFPQGKKTSWIKPGRASFTWLVEGENRLSVNNHKKYVDGCSKLGIETVVVDDGWELWPETEENVNRQDKWSMLKELVDYAKERNVSIWVWRSSSPRFGNKTDVGLVDPEERMNFMKKCAQIGVKGLKIDFFHTENFFTVQLMEDILKDAAKEKLMVIFHGVNKPTGDSYTYPNLLAKEAVRGLECVGAENSWAPGPIWPYHNTVIPFTRWLAGPADYTPLNFRKFCPTSTTYTHQLASIYMFTSPMLIFAADIEDMLSCPGREFIEEVPVEWDETFVLPESEIGKLAAIARRKEDTWYISVLNGEKARKFTCSFDFLSKGRYKLEIAYDPVDNRKKIEMKTIILDKEQKFEQELLSGGGCLIKLKKI